MMTMSYVKGESTLPEAPEKWVCDACGRTCHEVLIGENPFDPSGALQGCPHCREAETLVRACQVGDCTRPASGGHPGGYGYRYICTCWEHRPPEREE